MLSLLRKFLNLFRRNKDIEEDWQDEEEEEVLELPVEFERFLDMADEAYIRAYETRNLPCLKDFFTRECILRLGSLIANTAGGRYFANDKFRTTYWTPISRPNEKTWIVQKDVVFSDIHVAGSMRMKVSQDYTEMWTLYVTEEELLVSAVHLEG